jgi:hypothetical protein
MGLRALNSARLTELHLSESSSLKNQASALRADQLA